MLFDYFEIEKHEKLSITFAISRNKEIYGECSQVGKWKYLIRINENRLHGNYDLIETLAHELVHLRQFVNGDLRFSKMGNVVTFKGERFRAKNMCYYKVPWEVEAYGLQYGAVLHCIGSD